MAESPFRVPCIPLTGHAATTTAVEEYRTSSPPLSLNFRWKTPFISNTKKHPSARQDYEDEQEGESSQLPALPPFSWRKPVLASATETSSPAEEQEQEGGEGAPSSPPPVVDQESLPCSSLVIDLDDDNGIYELEHALMEEEEYSIPEYSQHRKLTGLDDLDVRLGLEAHFFVKEEDEGRKGLVCGSSLEVAGTPGSGKTTLLIQLAVRERLHGLNRAKERSKGKRKQDADEEEDWIRLGERSPQVMLIDTEGSIGMNRIVCIARQQIEQLDFITDSPGLLRSVLAGIHYCRCTSEVELLTLFQTLLPSTKYYTAASTQPSISEGKMHYNPRLPMRTTMIFIDTISYHLRAPLSDEARHLRNQRNMLIYEFKQFAERCRRRGINLVMANQMGFTIVNKDGATTSLSDSSGEGRLIPLLRNQNESILGPNEWRLLLFRAGGHHEGAGNRFAHFIGQPVLVDHEGEVEVLPSKWMPFIVDQGGIFESTIL